jgi:ankyrin repeat protein
MYDTAIVIRIVIALAFLLSGAPLRASGDKPSYPFFHYDVARAHEIKPHRRTIPMARVQPGFNQLHLTLTVSPTGDVVNAEARGDSKLLVLWPQLEGEVRSWKFTPFDENGEPVTVQIEEYIDLVPPERLPKNHVTPPPIRPDSKIAISLERSGCFGSCASYNVTLCTEGIIFRGSGYVAARGKHTDQIDMAKIQKLAKRFVTADFYSMDDTYVASVTDNPTFVLSIEIDGRSKRVEDYVGEWVGMPAVVSELEEEVDAVARAERWISGGEGLVQALKAEKFNFKTFDAQVMLKEVAQRGQANSVRELLKEGVPLGPIPAPKPKDPDEAVPFDHVGWLNAGSRHADVLQILVDAGASKNDQSDKNLALAGAAASGTVEAARILLAYGANPNADLSKLTFTIEGAGMSYQAQGAGSVMIYAAGSGNPEMVREMLSFHPDLEMRDREGKTAIFAAGEYRYDDRDGARVECVRLLAQFGANVNARDNEGNTPLHETFRNDVEEELLKRGADVNARNNEGETPIFTTVDNDALPLFIAHGADLGIRNNKGETVLEAAKSKGPSREAALRKAMENFNKTPD